MPDITAVVIASQAQRTIEACVRALRFCSRVVVGVNQSTDQTAELAAAAGAEVQGVRWLGYGATKNALLRKLTSGWILSVDADEIVTPELAQEIVATLGQDPNENAFWISRRNYFLGREIRHSGWRPDWQLRLFRAGTGRYEERAVHEALRVTGPVRRLRQALDHYSYADLADYVSRMNQYTSLAVRDRAARGRHFSLARLVFDPGWTFFKMYGLKSGWRDGFPGLALAAFSALNTLVKHAKQWELASQEGTSSGAQE